MHINFKYFIVSIGAIFLALGVGILIGTSMGSSVDIQEQNAAIVTDIDKQFKQLKEKDDKLAETNKNLLAKLDNVKDFIAGNENLLSNQKLSGKKVAIISFNEKANVDSVKNALTNSGASIYLDIQIKDEAVNTTNLEKINTKLGQKFTKKEEVISYIANSIKNSSDTSPLASLEELGLVKVRSNSGSYETINSIVVFNGSTASGKSKFPGLIKPILDQIKEDKYTVAIASSGESVGLKDFSKIKIATIDNIDENEIPEELLLKLLGSRKKILFCEGKRNSLDSKIFELLFEDYTITPVETCKDVINFTKAFNKIPNTVAKAYGIIDRDFHSEEQLEKLKQQNVFSYDVAEIENLFLLPDVIAGFAKYKQEQCDIEEIKTRILIKFEQDKQAQISQYVSSAINAYFKSSHISVGNKKEEVEQNFQKFISEVDINKLFNGRESYINDVIANKKYEKAIMLYNNKGLHSVIEKYFNMGDYRHKALDYLRGTKEIEPIKRVFPDQLWNAD